MPDQLQDVQRVAVRAGGPAGGSTWLRHGEEPKEALARLAPGATHRLTGVTSDVVTLDELGLRVHAIGFAYAVRPVDTVDPVDPAITRGEDGAQAALPLSEAPPTDLVDHLAGDGLGDEQADPDAAPLKVQRTGAYAVVLDGDNLLLTRLRRTRMWTLPGGGVDFGEHPGAAVVREVYEESGLALSDVHLVDASSNHWTGRAPYGRLEDFHAVRVLYRASVPRGSTPTVVEVGGSTEEVAWVPLAGLDDLDIGQTVHLALRHLR